MKFLLKKRFFYSQLSVGVYILLESSDIGTITDYDYQFILNITNLKNQKIIFWYIGYKPVIRKIDSGDLNLRTIVLESYEALESINGIPPKLNCNVYYRGYIYVNGQQGSYTMVLINVLPIVFELSAIYDFSLVYDGS